MNEISYYPEIMKCIETDLQSNFRAANISNIKIFWRSGELTKGIRQLMKDYPDYCSCLSSCVQLPLNLDIYAIVTNGVKFEIIILEVKIGKPAGLKEWSQLIGYNLVSDARYGILINIDNEVSKRLNDLLKLDPDISRIVRQKSDGSQAEHLFGFMIWNSITKNFEYSGLGQIKSLSALSRSLVTKFKND